MPVCGIFGYVGRKQAEPILIEGLRRLEYRGYDSAGVATLDQGRMHIRKKAGRVRELARHLEQVPILGAAGISHTRWATHGGATDVNAHPHLGESSHGDVAVVHNGVIENYNSLKRELQNAGVEFRSETDTEVIARLIAREDEGDLLTVLRRIIPAPAANAPPARP